MESTRSRALPLPMGIRARNFSRSATANLFLLTVLSLLILVVFQMLFGFMGSLGASAASLHFERFTNPFVKYYLAIPAVLFGLFALSAAVWFVSSFLFVIRYSLQTMMTCVFIFAACMSWYVGAPAPYGNFAILGFLILGGLIVISVLYYES